MLLASKAHTQGNTTRWTVRYDQWLDNTATIESVTVTSSSTSCTISPTPQVLGTDIVFFLAGGALGERVTVTLVMVDTLGNTKRDTIAFTVVAA
jgi:hypothetical protein